MEYQRLVILGIICGKKAPTNPRVPNKAIGMSVAMLCISSLGTNIKASAVAEAFIGSDALRLLGCGCLASVGLGELAAETLDASGGVDQLLLAGEEGVASGADFEDDVALVGGAGLKVRPAGALYGDGLVLRVNSFFRHIDPFAGSSLLRRLRLAFSGRGSLATVWSRHIDVPVAMPGRSSWGGKHFSHFSMVHRQPIARGRPISFCAKYSNQRS
jgi:hypothetical protein